MEMPNEPTIIVGDDGEIRCTPADAIPSDSMLAQIIATTKGKLPNGNLFVHIHPVDRSEFEWQGWSVSGIDSNFFGVGQHALKMRLPV